MVGALNEPESFARVLEHVSVDAIVPSTTQSRLAFPNEMMDELTQSVREHGIIEPLIVRRVGGDSVFELIAGERRWRAARAAGLRTVPVVVREANDQEAFELGLVENIQRESLNPIEYAMALQRLTEQYGYTHDALAERVGKDRSTVANTLRLLRLPESVQEKVTSGLLSEGHARPLVGLDAAQAEQLAQRVTADGLSVRQTENLARAKRPGRTKYTTVVHELTQAIINASSSGIELYERLAEVERSEAWRTGRHHHFEGFLASNWPSSLGVHRYHSVMEAIGLYGLEMIRQVGSEAAHCLLEPVLVADNAKRAALIEDLNTHLQEYGVAPAVSEIRRLVKHHVGEVQSSQTASRAAAIRARDAELFAVRQELREVTMRLHHLQATYDVAVKQKDAAVARSVKLSKELTALKQRRSGKEKR
jgi:ParB family chromosome partitioning protein